MTCASSFRLRSLLFVPAHVDRFIARAHERGADGIILDLEDSVPVTEKEAARSLLSSSIASVRQNGGAALVRVNHGLRHLVRDLEAAIMPGLSALVLPKVESPDFVREIANSVSELESERGMAQGAVRFILQIETPSALFVLPAIAEAHSRVLAMALGPEDYSASIGGVPESDTLFTPNYAVLCAARAAGIVPLGFVGSIGDYSDLEKFAETIRSARRLGFRGALVVHPSQVSVLNEGFAPTAAEIDWARRVVAEDQNARAEGRGAFQLDGRMIDTPVVRRAEEILGSIGDV